MKFSGRKVEVQEMYYGFTAKPGFYVGYATVEETDNDIMGEYPFAMSGWSVAGLYCIYLYRNGQWNYSWYDPNDHETLKDLIASLIEEDLAEAALLEEDVRLFEIEDEDELEEDDFDLDEDVIDPLEVGFEVVFGEEDLYV